MSFLVLSTLIGIIVNFCGGKLCQLVHSRTLFSLFFESKTREFHRYFKKRVEGKIIYQNLFLFVIHVLHFYFEPVNFRTGSECLFLDDFWLSSEKILAALEHPQQHFQDLDVHCGRGGPLLVVVLEEQDVVGRNTSGSRCLVNKVLQQSRVIHLVDCRRIGNNVRIVLVNFCDHQQHCQT